jgi:tetratricopeptide (TPR) repeat protein
MAFEKAKVIKAAEKFLAQGKISAAIKEYRQIIEHDDNDLTTLNMLGDLLARAGEKEEAASCFLRIAEHFREQEFRLKAIAMYRKIEKLKPRDPATAKELADLYAAQGLIADARTQYLVVADAYTRAGENKQVLKVLHRIADLDPHNTDIRLKLAEGYLKESMPADAAKAYSEAASRLHESAQFEKSLAAYSKALELRPNDMVALRGLVSAHVALGTADDAAELLEKAVAAEPDDVELISMLAQAYVDAEDAPGAERATAMLMSQDASNHRRYIEVARVYLKLGQEDEAARIIGNIIEPMLSGREENDLLELVNELLDRNPEHVAGLRLLARIHWWQRDMEKLRAALERLAESAEAAGLAEEERYALTQLVRLAPEEQRYLDRLNMLGGALEEVSEGEQLPDDAALSTVPSFEGFAIVEETAPDVAEAPEETSEFEWNSVAEEGVAHAEISFADLNEAEVTGDVAAANVLVDPMLADPFASGFDSAELARQTATEPLATREQGDTAKAEAMMHHELESVDFYIAQNYSDIALNTLEMLERQFGPHAEIDTRRERLKTGPKEARTGDVESVSKTVETSPVPGLDSEVDVVFGDVQIKQPAGDSRIETGKPPAVTPPRPFGSGIDSGLAEIFEEFRMEAEGESASSNEDYETHYNMATAYKEMDLLDEAIREFQTAAALTGSADGTTRYFQCCNMLGHCFVQKGMPQAAVLWFKKGLEAPGRNPEEYKALQYELGTAYEEMGDLTRAVAALTEVYGVDVGYRDIAAKLESLQARAAAQAKKRKK